MMLIQEEVLLAPYTTFGIGGPARWFTEAKTEDDIVEAARFARERSVPLFVLGGGSNLLVSDAGFPGLVVKIGLKGIESQVAGDETVFSIAAGEEWDAFVSLAVSRNAGGVECLAGIPGTVGGTPVQNVGAYGQEVAETIQGVRVFDLQTFEFCDIAAADCGFSYRRSRFNGADRGKFVVMAVTYRLKNDVLPIVSYVDLKYHFQERGVTPSLAEVSKVVRQIRWKKGMLLVEGDQDCHSAGSFFKNPVISTEHFARIAAEAGTATIPRYPAGEGRVKLPAAWLLDQAGFHKGYALGRAGISSRHTLALINRGGATAAEVGALRDRIITGVEEKFGIRLEPEPVWVS